MNYQQFVSAVEVKIKQQLGSNISVCVHTTLKNNGRQRIGITVSEQGINISPTIYLEEYYEEFLKNTPLEDIAKNILELYKELKYEHSWDIAPLQSYHSVKDRIFHKLIHASENEAYLQTVPHVLYLDFAIVFGILYEMTETGTATIPITNTLLNLWGVTTETISEQAHQNTPHLMPFDFKPMRTVINELLGNDSFSDYAEEDCMYILTNQSQNFGAACILYPDVLSNIARKLKENYYVLPSSIHEVIIVPESQSPCRTDLDCMIRDINETQVSPEEVLSNRAYYFSQQENRLLL